MSEKYIGLDTPFNCFKRDLSNYFAENEIDIFDEHGDVLVVTHTYMTNKTNTRLNRQLGLYKINKFGQKMSRIKKSKP